MKPDPISEMLGGSGGGEHQADLPDHTGQGAGHRAPPQGDGEKLKRLFPSEEVRFLMHLAGWDY